MNNQIKTIAQFFDAFLDYLRTRQKEASIAYSSLEEFEKAVDDYYVYCEELCKMTMCKYPAKLTIKREYNKQVASN